MLKTGLNAFSHSGTQNNKKAKSKSFINTIADTLEDTVTAATKAVTNPPSLPDIKTSGKKHTASSGIISSVVSSAKTAVERQGQAIKSTIKNVLSKKYGELDTRHLFDGIDDKDIEDNIETAENAIKTNIDRGTLSKNTLPKLPNLRDGLALSYAAANKGNSKAATRAREAAYMETEPLVKETGMKLLSTQLPKFENAVMPTNEKTKMTTQPTKHSSFYDDYLNNKKFQDNKKLWNPIGKTCVFPEENKNPRYVKADVLNMRSAPGTGSKIVGTLTNGTEVNFTGRKTEEIDGHLWAEVEYGGKKGWVAADYLKEEKPKNSSSHDHQDSSFSAPVISQKPKPSVSVDSSNNGSKIDINDHSALQTAFSQVRKTGATADDIGEPGDFDGSGELQCPDVPKWFISKFTTLSPVRGNGKEQVENLANTYGLEVSTTPCAPAVFSVAGGSSGPGTSGRNDGGYGHTGIILSCELTESGDYKLTYFHTYHSLLKDGMTSDIREWTFTPEELKNTTFLDLKDYMI